MYDDVKGRLSRLEEKNGDKCKLLAIYLNDDETPETHEFTKEELRHKKAGGSFVYFERSILQVL